MRPRNHNKPLSTFIAILHAFCNAYCAWFLQESDLKRLHTEALEKDPFISQAIGPNAKIERMKAGSLRLGSQGIKQSYDDHVRTALLRLLHCCSELSLTLEYC